MAALLQEREAALASGQSERQFCVEAAVPRSTVRDEVTRTQRLDVAPELAAFGFSPQGLAFFMRIVLAAHFVMTVVGSCGVPLVCTFLQLAGLSPFVGTSYGAQRRFNEWLLQQLADFGRREHERLGKNMPHRTLWLCEDETFFSRMVLVAIEAASNYVLLEQYSDRRDAAGWNVVNGSFEGLNVTVVGATSDRAKGIQAHVEQSFGLRPTPDLFHVQQDVSRGCSAALASRVRAAEARVEQTQRQGIEDSESMAEMRQAREQRERVTTAIAGMSEACRPYDERTGEPRRGEVVRTELNEMLDEIEAVANEAGLSTNSHDGVDKARRAVDAMAASIEDYHQRLALNLDSVGVPQDIRLALETQLLPALYLRRIAGQSRDADIKRRLHARARTLAAPLQDEQTSPLMALSEAAVADLMRQCEDWVALHVRSSSCVEGRNGQLELHHHGMRGMSALKLAALTVVHNFWARRLDGTTAAARFFGQRPRDLFEWLLETMPDLPRPARRRPRVAPSPLLN